MTWEESFAAAGFFVLCCVWLMVAVSTMASAGDRKTDLTALLQFLGGLGLLGSLAAFMIHTIWNASLRTI